MQKAPLVSVVTVVYNGVKYIEQTIQSVLGQTYPHIEYIIIDGGSTDGTQEIIKKYESRISFWISEKDRGISDGFNKGITRASGEVVGLINADDWYEPHTVEKVVQQLLAGDIFYGDLRLFRHEEAEFIVKGDHHILSKMMSVNHPTVFVKKEVYDRLGLFDESFSTAMDYELMVRFAANNCRFVYIPAVLANMRWDGTSDKYWMRGCRETLQVKNRYYPKNKTLNYLYYLRHLAGIAIPRYMEKMKLQFIVKAYRKRFALQKKIYEGGD